MKRTRKWAYVEQEAKRLAELGLSAAEIGKHLGVDRSTVTRWVQQGKLPKGGGSSSGHIPVAPQTPGEWASDVRKAYALDATDDQLVTLGQAALIAANDPRESTATRMSAMGRFQAIVKQLGLVARQAAADPKDEPKPAPVERPRRSGGDPRRVLMAVN